MNLYFQNSQGKMRVIAKISDDISIEEARAEVAKQIASFAINGISRFTIPVFGMQ